MHIVCDNTNALRELVKRRKEAGVRGSLYAARAVTSQSVETVALVESGEIELCEADGDEMCIIHSMQRLLAPHCSFASTVTFFFALRDGRHFLTQNALLADIARRFIDNSFVHWWSPVCKEPEQARACPAVQCDASRNAALCFKLAERLRPVISKISCRGGAMVIRKWKRLKTAVRTHRSMSNPTRMFPRRSNTTLKRER